MMTRADKAPGKRALMTRRNSGRIHRSPEACPMSATGKFPAAASSAWWYFTSPVM
jgi:hypothetical protein